MPRLNITQLAAERLRAPADVAVTHWDVNLPGFGLRVSPKGRKTWVAQYRVRGGKEVLETIGTMYVIPTVGEARNRARASIDKARRGIHPIKEREQHEAADKVEQAARVFTFAALVQRYLTERLEPNAKPSTVNEIGRLL